MSNGSTTTLTCPDPAALATLDDLATKINEHHRQAELAIRSGLDHALAAGRLLIKAKSLCPHGTWSDWLGANFDGSHRTAQVYVRIAKRWPEIEAKAQDSAHLSLEGAVKLLAAPRAEKAKPPDLPAGFVPVSGQYLAGCHHAFDMTAYVAESIEHPGYWNIIVFDLRPNQGSVIGMCRPVIAYAVPTAFRGVLDKAPVLPDSFDWHVNSEPKCAVQEIRKWCEEEANFLYYSQNSWWIDRAKRLRGG